MMLISELNTLRFPADLIEVGKAFQILGPWNKIIKNCLILFYILCMYKSVTTIKDYLHPDNHPRQTVKIF